MISILSYLYVAVCGLVICVLSHLCSAGGGSIDLEEFTQLMVTLGITLVVAPSLIPTLFILCI